MNIIKKTRGPSGTDLGMDGHGGPGKGSRPRSCFSPAYRKSYDRIFRKKSPALKKVRSRLVEGVVKALLHLRARDAAAAQGRKVRHPYSLQAKKLRVCPRLLRCAS